MSGGFSVRWVILANHFPVIRAQMLPRADAIVAKAAVDIVSGAKDRAPVDTGTLRNSIQAIKIAPAFWRVIVGVDYGVYVEWGTRFMAAQPFLRPAAVAVAPSFRAAMRQVVAA